LLIGAALALIMSHACTPQKPPVAAAAATAPSPIGDGSPRIADCVDAVHIEYQVYGRGDPAVMPGARLAE